MSRYNSKYYKEIQSEIAYQRKLFLQLINEQLKSCYCQDVSAVSERMAKKHGPDICIDFSPFEPLELNEIPVTSEGFSDFENRVGSCTRALELVKQFERAMTTCEHELERMAANLENGSGKQ